MKNFEIIEQEMLNAGLDPETDVIDTFAGWKKKGFSVKKGAKAVFTTRIWKPKTKAEIEKEKAEAEENDEPALINRFKFVPASYFLQEQVERKEVA